MGRDGFDAGGFSQGINPGPRNVVPNRQSQLRPIFSYGNFAAQWQGAGGGGIRQYIPCSIGVVRPCHRDVDPNQQSQLRPIWSYGNLAAQWQGAGGGGIQAGISSSCLVQSELYDPATGSWTQTGNLNVARCIIRQPCCPMARCWWRGDSSAFLLIVISGAAPAFNSIILFNRSCTTLPPGRGPKPAISTSPDMVIRQPCCPMAKCWWRGDGATGLSCSIGAVRPCHRDVDPNRQSQLRCRSGHTATLLPNGKVLVAGGGETGISLGTVRPCHRDVDPNRQSQLRPMLSLRQPCCPMARCSWREDSHGTILYQSELYDPATGTWSQTGNLNYPRYSHTATLLPNGKVLVAGDEHTIFINRNCSAQNKRNALAAAAFRVKT